MELEFFVCEKCGQIVKKIVDSNNSITCCGEPMKKLVPNKLWESREKHLPLVVKQDNYVKVTVGEIIHPMDKNHYIEWIIIYTNKGSYKKNLTPGDLPLFLFKLSDGEEVLHAYAYCNLHGLWAA